MDLNFQNFENTNSDQTAFSADRGNFVPPSSSVPGGEQPTKRSNLFSFEYYQQFFDVETDQVVKRVINSVIPTHRNYITDFVQPIPDLWGPFWVSVTLVFAIGVFGNLAQFIENDGAKGEYGSDFRMVTSAATLIFLYVIVVPLLIFALTWYRRAELQYPYVDLVCLYGYSIAIFVPVSLLWIVDINWFRWVLILVSVGLSGAVLGRAIWPSLQTDPNKAIAFGTIGVVLLLHFLLAFSFKEYYFDAMHPRAEVAVPEVPKVAPTTAAPIVTNVTPATEKKAPESGNQLAPTEADKPKKKEKRNSSEVEKKTESTVTPLAEATTKKAEVTEKKEEVKVTSSTEKKQEATVTSSTEPKDVAKVTKEQKATEDGKKEEHPTTQTTQETKSPADTKQ